MNESKKVNSIAKKLNREWILKLASIYVIIDVVFFMILVFVMCFVSEETGSGSFQLLHNRDFVESNYLRELKYSVTYDQNPIQVVPLGVFIIRSIVITGWIVIIQIINISWNIISNSYSIRIKLSPLNDMAKKAEQLSSIAFDDQKYQNLEDAISNMTDDVLGASLHTEDPDLKGIEIALNSLLDRMRDAYKQQSRFVSDASHELRTPIAVIQGYVNMLDRWGKEDEKILNESIEAIKHESENMKKLVEQLLFLARGDSGRNPITIEEFSLTEVIREVYEESLMIDENHIYTFKEGEEDVKIAADISMIKQAARILVDNAAKYSEEHGAINISVGKNNDGKAFFAVQDEGIGMSEEDAKHAFERFYRSDVARDRKTGGTGLGLSIAKWIVNRHSGYFEVLSREGLGTRIKVIL